jgi:hypothetical protein
MIALAPSVLAAAPISAQETKYFRIGSRCCAGQRTRRAAGSAEIYLPNTIVRAQTNAV